MKTTRLEIEIALLFGFLLGIINVAIVPVTSIFVPEPYRLFIHAVLGALVSIALGIRFGFLKTRS
jgi:hypothetical protein